MAREHKKRGYKMAPFTLVMQVMKGQIRQYVDLHGTECLAPARKNPLTNALILKMLSTPEGSTHGRLKVKWGSLLLGLGHGDLLHAGGDGSAQGGGVEGHGDYCIRQGAPHLRVHHLVHQRHPHGRSDDRAAPRDHVGLGMLDRLRRAQKRSVRRVLRLQAGVDALLGGCSAQRLPGARGARDPRGGGRGLAASNRATTPLFGPALGQEWCHSLLDNVFVTLLRCGAGLSEEECRAYSVHSFRIFLACALYAASAPTSASWPSCAGGVSMPS